MWKLFLFLAILSAYFGICGESESQPASGMVYCARTDFGVEIKWYYPCREEFIDGFEGSSLPDHK